MLRALFCSVFYLSLMLHPAFAAPPPGAPVVTVDGLTITDSQVNRGEQTTVSLSTSIPDGVIYYTLDGSEPSAGSTRYTSSFLLQSSVVLRAIAYSIDFSQSSEGDPLEIKIVPYVK